MARARLPNGLTPQQEEFAQAVAAGMSLSDAYRAHYRCQGWKEKSIWERASTVAKIVKVASRIAELKAQVAQKAVEHAAISKEWVIQGLMETIAEARQAVPVLDAKGNPTGEYRQNLAAAVRGYELLGKELAMFIDRKEIRTGKLDGMTRDELEARALELSKKLGIDDHAAPRRH